MDGIDSQTWPVVSALLDQWLDLPPQNRAAWLAGLSPEFDEVLPRLRAMLQKYEQAEKQGFLETPPFACERQRPAAEEAAPLPMEGSSIGPYRLLRQLGRGGMASVWLAEGGDTALKRKVALKIPHLAAYDGMFAERFARERDILAQLNDPRIARLYDAGVSGSGQPYLVLEHVEGTPITSYCDERRLPLSDRIRLFLQVLRAVRYAHANLIVHRDLKPSNILVTADGEVKLLDFGIAKLLTDGQGKESELTRAGGRSLTPDYASPEQVLSSVITTASDLYSLGILLCELLTGERPYKATRDTVGGLEDAILNRDAARPSQLARDEPQARLRRLSAKKLASALKGDLDTIILKALQKNPEMRYPTADAFADDLECYLHGEPVRARPESTWYRARKFVLRNRLAVGSAATVIAALGIGLGVAIHQAQVAQAQALKAKAVQDFLEDIFQANSTAHTDPVRARQTSARELLDLGATKLDAAFGNAPGAKLSVLTTLAGLYADLGMKDQAAAINRKRVDLAKATFGPTDSSVAEALVDLAIGLGETSSVNQLPVVIAEAERVLDANRDYKSRYRALLHRAKARYSLDYDAGKSVEEDRKTVQILRALPDKADLVMALNALGQSLTVHHDFREAIGVLSEAANIAESQKGETKARLAEIYAYLGNTKYRTLDISGAEKSYRLAVETARQVSGEDHEDVVQTKQRLGYVLCETGRFEEGLKLMREALDLAVRTKGPDDLFHVGGTSRSYGIKLVSFGRVEAGMAHLARTAELERKANRKGTLAGRRTLEYQAYGDTLLGHYERARQLLEEAGDSKEFALTRAHLELAMGQPEQAERTLSASLPPEESATEFSLNGLQWTLARAETQLALRHNEEAMRFAGNVKARLEGSPVRPYWKDQEAAADLVEGQALLAAGRAADALPLLEQAVTLNREILDKELSLVLARSQSALAECLTRVGRPAEAEKFLAAAQAIRSRHKTLEANMVMPVGGQH